MSSPSSVSILLLGSGWTSQFVIPALKARSIPFAYTKRAPRSIDVDAVAFEAAREGSQKMSAFQALPRAQMVVIVFPLISGKFVEDIVNTYEKAKGCSPAWLALGSTSAWPKGISTSSSPILETNTRAASEAHLLSMHSGSSRPTAVLNLSGLYGSTRNPANFAKKVGETIDKLEEKTSLHLVHGKDVASAIIGMWDVLQDSTTKDKLWGRRWIVTDTHVYDWWQLFTTLQPPPNDQTKEWIKELTSKHSVTSLPRPIIGQSSDKDRDRAPYVLDRALDGKAFWEALEKKPTVGRCDDYGPGGGGRELQEAEQSREAL